jgi:hypothetical protein
MTGKPLHIMELHSGMPRKAVAAAAAAAAAAIVLQESFC